MLRCLLLALAIALASGCSHRERIVVLPGPDGKVGTVVVQGQAGETTLNTAYAAAEVAGKKVEPRQMTEAEVQQRYGAALQATPKRPASFTLLFALKTQTALESKATISAIMAEYAGRPAPEVTVIGHTDQWGEAQYNEELSRRRAEAVRDLLVKEGIPKEAIEVRWRGDKEPAPNLAGTDPKNRRVEVRIR